MTNPFHVGQRICFKIGHKPMRVTRINGKYIDALYLDNRNKRIYNRCWLDFKSLPEEQPEPAVGYDDTRPVYDTLHGHATIVGKRRDGVYVMETFPSARGPSALVAVGLLGPRIYDYTVKLENIVDKYTFYRRVKRGSVSLNDVIKRENGKLYRIIQLDTHSSNQQWLKGEVLKGRPI